jgi:hypothetical protein
VVLTFGEIIGLEVAPDLEFIGVIDPGVSLLLLRFTGLVKSIPSSELPEFVESDEFVVLSFKS